jgi:hypothetical protein
MDDADVRFQSTFHYLLDEVFQTIILLANRPDDASLSSWIHLLSLTTSLQYRHYFPALNPNQIHQSLRWMITPSSSSFSTCSLVHEMPMRCMISNKEASGMGAFSFFCVGTSRDLEDGRPMFSEADCPGGRRDFFSDDLEVVVL